MRRARIAPLAIVASFGLAFASACGEERTAADAAAATAPGPDTKPAQDRPAVYVYRRGV
ncbi:hypothetical protein Ade02nite_56610 [Paractinoplanes deccanensis]|uniref:Uncharacterized protein n=1 Tax=Paractinoplanes deccanensis TaxID=113561 RepID=A0ABQ3YAR3_9ACTN|nr:hypothetical protein [Actinoplanes deccanensis]GID77020.1 hypothetical protein Ade02nite_56610 [Actinoplanes deccanensis]